MEGWFLLGVFWTRQDRQWGRRQVKEAYGANRDFLDIALKQATEGASFNSDVREFQHLGTTYFIDRWSERFKNRLFFADLVLY